LFETYGRVFGDYRKPRDLPRTPRPFGLSPVRYLVKSVAGRAGLSKVTYISEFFPNGEDSLGSTQIVRMLNGSERPLFDQASLIVGVDAFYWDAISDNCGPGLDQTITALIERARDAGKTLILGTVPIEDPAKVRINSDAIGINMWWPPVPECAIRINQLLNRRCTEANRCLVVDLAAAVARLNAGESLPLGDGGRYDYYQMRPDGVHLSDKGSRYVAELMVTELRKTATWPRPQCDGLGPPSM
jgi:hypothetical protein